MENLSAYIIQTGLQKIIRERRPTLGNTDEKQMRIPRKINDALNIIYRKKKIKRRMKIQGKKQRMRILGWDAIYPLQKEE